MNRVLGALVVAAGLLSPMAAAGDDPAKAEVKKLQGKWMQREMRRNNAKPELVNLIHGRDLKEGEQVSALFFVAVKDNKFTFWYDEKKTRQATVKLDPSKDPKRIDLTLGKGKPFLGIYKVKGDSLTICIGDQKNRPTEFDGSKTGRLLIQYKKDKP